MYDPHILIGYPFLNRYGFVGAALVATSFLNIWQMRMVDKARSLAKIFHPQSEATSKLSYNKTDADPRFYFQCTPKSLKQQLRWKRRNSTAFSVLTKIPLRVYPVCLLGTVFSLLLERSTDQVHPFNTAYFGLAYPKTAAASLIAWVVGRVIYTVGYATGQPKKVST